MRREELGAGGLALVLFVAAAAVAAPFRAEALRQTTILSVSWDAALHGLSGLDLFDDLRLLRPFDALGDVLSQHWWGPLFGIVLTPCFALLGRSLAAATFPSFAAYLLAAPAAFLAAKGALGRLPVFETAALAALVGAFVLRAPMLLETSSWIMLESLGGFVSVAALGLFAAAGDVRARRAAFALGAALFFLKVHYGFFVLATLGVATWVRENREGRARALDVLRRGASARPAVALASTVALLVPVRLALEARGGDAIARLAPSVPNILWGGLVLSLALACARRRLVVGAWNAAPPALRDFGLWGVAPTVAWCLDPANVRGWYRQIFQPTDAPFRPLAQLSAYLAFLRWDYSIADLPYGVVLAGLGLALALPGSAARRTLAAFAIWPILLMALNTYPAEARFVGCLAPALFAAAAAGLVALASRLPRLAARALLLAVLVALGASFGAHEGAWRREVGARATYRYSWDEAEQRAVAAALADTPAAGRAGKVVSPDPPVWPTVRLGIRLARPDLPPADVKVDGR